MDGLECNEITKSDILKDNDEFRIDNGYYEKQYFDVYKRLKNKDLLGDICSMHDVSSNGSFAYVQNILKDNNKKVIPYIRSGNVGNTFLDLNDLICISKEAHQKLSLSRTNLHDIMMARKGKIGGATIITENEVDLNCNENVIKLNLIDKEKWNPFYLTAYLNSKYGKKQLERISTGNVQPWVSIYQIKKIKCYYLSQEFQNSIEQTMKTAKIYLDKSKESYSKAEQMLMSELDIKEQDQVPNSFSVKSLSSSYLLSGRLDAAYYQLKYDIIESSIKSYIGGYKYLGEVVEDIFTGEYTEEYFKQNKGLKFYIRSTNIEKGQVIIDENYFVDGSRFNRTVKEGDIITARVGTIGIFASIDKELDNAICSDNVICFRLPKVYCSEVYTLMFNSKLYYELFDRFSRGSVQQRLNQETLKDLIIPILRVSLQRDVHQKLMQSFSLLQQSKQLIEFCKKTIEIAIEEGEAAGLKYLEEFVNKALN